MTRPDPLTPPDDSFNPYTSPQAELKPIAETARGPRVPFSIGEILSRAWAVYQERMGFCIALTLVGTIATYAAQVIGFLGVTIVGAIVPDPITIIVLGLVVGAAFLLLSVLLWTGQMLAYLKVAQERQATFGDLFAGGPFLLRTILAFFLISLAMSGAMILGSIPGGIASAALGPNSTVTNLVMGVGLLAATVFVVIYSIYFSQVMFVILDRPNLGAVESLKYSVRIAKGHWFGILAVILIAGLINLGGALLLGIGLIFTVPYSFLILAVAYTALQTDAGGARMKPATDYLG